jgi:hypothetical protein
MSPELQLYFKKVCGVIKNFDRSIVGSESSIKTVLKSTSTDNGIQPAVPFFVHFIVSEVNENKWMNGFADATVC